MLGSESHRKYAAEQRDQSPKFLAGDNKRRPQRIRNREITERWELKRGIPQSGILTFGLTSELLIVDLILNSRPTVLRFAL